MIEFKIKPFLDVQDILVQWSQLLHNNSRYLQGDSVSAKLRKELADLLKPLMVQLNAPEFAMCRQGGERLIRTLETREDPVRIVSAVDDLRRRLLDQSELTACLSLSSKEQDLYKPSTPLFGAAFQTKFATDGAFELDEAAKCLALGRATATVFHMMRLMEIAVRAVARCLNIPDPIQPADRSWGAILKKVRDSIDAKWPTVAARSTGDGEVFDALYASLDAVKNPLRRRKGRRIGLGTPPTDFFRSLLGGTPLDCSATFRNTRSKSGLGCSAPTSRAMSMKRFDCSGSSGWRLGLRGMPA
jgi:hypothetical protein